MVTKDDLKIVNSFVEELDNTTWAFVEYNGDRYILTSQNVTDEVLDKIRNEDPYLGLLFQLGLARYDCAVFRGDKDWVIKGKCDDSCAQGICTKRIAQARPENPSIDVCYNLLIDYLNS